VSQDDARPARKKRTLGGGTTAGAVASGSFAPEEIAIEPAPPPPEDAFAYKKLQLGFMVAVVAGLGTALLGYAPGLEAVGFGGPMLSIIGFYIFGKLQGFVDRSDTRQQFADSCYFLGFLLTMIAMLVGFLPAGLFQQPITSQGILRHFSIALGATALGLIFRIFVLQGGRTLGQITAEVEAGLTHYALRVSEEARLIGDELAGLRSDLETQRHQVGTIISKDLKEVAEAAFAPLTRSVEKIANHLETQSQSIAGSAADLQQSLNRSAEQLGQAAEMRADASEAAHGAMASVAEALQQFDAQMSALRSQLAGVVGDSIDEISKMTDALQKGTALAPALEPALQAMTSNVAVISTRLDELGKESTRIAERLNDSLTDDDKLLARLEGVQEEVISGIREAGNRASVGITQESELARSEIEQVRTRLAEQFTEERQAFSSELASATDRLAEILHAFSNRIEEVRAGSPR
jgi:hypothetical protein